MMENKYEYEVQGWYYGGWERLTTEETAEAAVDMKRCYDENETGVPHRVKKIRVKEGGD